ncbi:MAG: hypothetical protein H6818_19630 [Phycisphaerales bacterium]|nr:hypothetical protein [Phycisphaerales bacterium]MCB9863678.1 hypothetical protein [Phycisphaerales bacterium]
MKSQLNFSILAQPTETTCGPTCLHAVYNYFDDAIPLDQVIEEVDALGEGGTLAVYLACHALRRGYSAKIYTYNLHVFDPTWFNRPGVDIAEKLQAQSRAKPDPKLRGAIEGYLEFLHLGGKLRFRDLTAKLIREPLKMGRPIITGLSATYLYHSIREIGLTNTEDDILGTPVGHFVVLCGYDKIKRDVLVADPLTPNPFSETQIYAESIERVLGAILLGVVTYDANLLIIDR